MDWIKRNLYFLVGGAVALALMGMAGWFLYSKWEANNAEMQKLDADYAELQTLSSENPHPGSGKVDNTRIARAQQEELEALIQKAKAKFERIPPIPDVPQPTESDFAAALSRTIDKLQKAATNASVALPANYRFSFEAQYTRVSFASNSIPPLAVQLGEVKAICDVLFQAKINSLDNIRREKVSSDDTTAQMTDYIDKKSVTNELAFLSPYEITFRAFSSELASVLSGFASSPCGIIVRSINVEPGPVQTATTDEQQPVFTQPQYIIQQTAPTVGRDSEASAAFQRRYGIGGGSRYGGRGPMPTPAAPVQPQTIYITPQASATSGKPKTVLDERQLKVTLGLTVVKLLPENGARQPPPPPADPSNPPSPDQPATQ